MRRIFAAAFLILLLTEWGSHSVIEADPLSGDGLAISENEAPHSDICDTLILCSDNSRNDQQKSGLRDEVIQHGAAPDKLSDVSCRIWLRAPPGAEFSSLRGLFRPKTPPFHPPETS